MGTPAFLRSLLRLATCDSLDELLAAAETVLERELGLRGTIELWETDDARFARAAPPTTSAHSTWIGIRYTIGAIHLEALPAEPADVELLADQLAPLAERLIELEASRRRTIREDIERLYERRIRDALIRRDWNASAVARELAIGRGRIAEVARRWRR